MANSKLLGGLILGAATAMVAYRWYTMTQEEKDELILHIKQTTHTLLDNADGTVEKIEQYITQMKEKGEGEWVDKLHIFKRMLHDFYGQEKTKAIGN